MVIPDFIYDQTSYYTKLQQQAVHYQNGEFDKLEVKLDDPKVNRQKNEILVPLYSEIVYLIRHMNETDENKIVSDFEDRKNQVLLREVR